MRQYSTWTPMRVISEGMPAVTSIANRESIVRKDGLPWGHVSTTIERISAGTYHVQTLTYVLNERGSVDLSTQRVVDKGLEWNLRDARIRGEQSHRQGMAELTVAAVQS